MKHQGRTGPASEGSGRERDQEQGAALALLGAVLGIVGVVLLLVGLAGGSGGAVQARPADKVLICHFDRNLQGPNAGPHVIEINENAVEHHLVNHVKKASFVGDDFIIEDETDLARCLGQEETPTITATVMSPTATTEATATATTEATATATTEATATATTEATATATTEAIATATEAAAVGADTPVPTATEEAVVLAETPIPTEEAAVLGVQALPVTGSGSPGDSGVSKWVPVGAIMVVAGLGLLMTSWRLSREP